MRNTVTKKLRVLSLALAILLVLSVISFPSMKAKAAGTVDDFVERCYTVTLDRGSDPDGFADWKGQLLNGEAVGVHVAYGFLFSSEYTKKNKSNKDYVTDLYMLFMGREPDEAGFNDWVGQLEAGKSRTEVFVGFANSQEFYNICESYGITAGRWVNGYDRIQVNNVNLFVERLYKVCFGRIGDIGGQKNWVEKLLNKQITGSECARSFIQSQEYENLGLSDAEYVENLYISLMGRASDAEGKENWINALASGKTRDEVFAGFVNSVEFANICNTYKIDRGSYTAKNVGKTNVDQQAKRYRVSRRDYSNGDYTIIEYKDGGNESTKETRYDSAGNFRGYEYIYEHNSDFTEKKFGKTFFEDDGKLKDNYFYREEYNKDGTLKTHYYCDEGWNTQGATSYEYTLSGNVSLLVKVTGYGDDLEYKYDNKNRIISINGFGNNGEPRTIEIREYFNQKENEEEDIKKISRTTFNAFGVKTTKVSEYDGNGNVITDTTYNDEGEETEIKNYKYDKNGNMIKETVVRKGITTSVECEYDSNGNKTKTICYDEHGNKGSYNVLTYNSNNKKTSDIYYDAEGKECDGWKYEYDNNNNILKETYFSSYLISTTEYEYDRNNNLITETRKRKLDQNPEETYWIIYKYEEY
ncbi:MAG: DUF4214 domain-containing protein [Lachnospiraceae bacterium]|nr:DUF4214 domain-containing protein [Lachnospiraceae bacterium]